MIAAAATQGNVVINNVIPAHLEAISAKLMECGVEVIEGDNGNDFYMQIISNSRPRASLTCTICPQARPELLGTDTLQGV